MTKIVSISFLAGKLSSEFYKSVENPPGVSWSGCRFRMELDRQKRQSFMTETFNCTVVGVSEPDVAVRREGTLIDGKTVVLAGNVYRSIRFVPDWIVDPMVSVLHLECRSPEGQ